MIWLLKPILNIVEEFIRPILIIALVILFLNVTEIYTVKDLAFDLFGLVI